MISCLFSFKIFVRQALCDIFFNFCSIIALSKKAIGFRILLAVKVQVILSSLPTNEVVFFNRIPWTKRKIDITSISRDQISQSTAGWYKFKCCSWKYEHDSGSTHAATFSHTIHSVLLSLVGVRVTSLLGTRDLNYGESDWRWGTSLKKILLQIQCTGFLEKPESLVAGATERATSHPRVWWSTDSFYPRVWRPRGTLCLCFTPTHDRYSKQTKRSAESVTRLDPRSGDSARTNAGWSPHIALLELTRLAAFVEASTATRFVDLAVSFSFLFYL